MNLKCRDNHLRQFYLKCPPPPPTPLSGRGVPLSRVNGMRWFTRPENVVAGFTVHDRGIFITLTI